EPVAVSEPPLDHVRPDEAEPPPDLLSVQDLNVSLSPSAEPRHDLALSSRNVLPGGEPQVPGLSNAQPVCPLRGDVFEVEEQLDRLPDKGQLLQGCELQPERSR